MVFNATFKNISVISWRSVLLVDETGVPGENHQSLASHWQTFDTITSPRIALIGVSFVEQTSPEIYVFPIVY